MHLPHVLTVITPALVTDEYDNPTLARDYGPAASRRTVQGMVQPATSTEPTELHRRAVITTWTLFTTSPVSAAERIEWQDRTFEIDGDPARWSPRVGYVHYEAALRHVRG